MAYCTNCGQQLNDGAKFCSNCGNPTTTPNDQRRTVYEGELHKCPNCGELLNSFITNCPACGNELRDISSSNAINDFSKEINEIIKSDNKNGKKKAIERIRTFPIPNTKEDLFEFIILSSSNIRKDRYSGNISYINKELSDAWETKFEQAYEKAKLTFADSSEFEKIQDIYISKVKKEQKSKSQGFFNYLTGWGSYLFLILVLLIIVGVIFGVDHIKIEKENARLEAIVVEVYQAIEDENYTLARAKAASLTFSGTGTVASDESSDKWDTTRLQLLDTIDRAEYGENYVPSPREIKIGFSNDEFKNQDYQEVEKWLKNRGFTNVKTEPVADLITGWISSGGDVDKVSIDGNTVFNKDTKYLSDVEIIIYYHVFILE